MRSAIAKLGLTASLLGLFTASPTRCEAVSFEVLFQPSAEPTGKLLLLASNGDESMPLRLQLDSRYRGQVELPPAETAWDFSCASADLWCSASQSPGRLKVTSGSS